MTTTKKMTKKATTTKLKPASKPEPTVDPRLEAAKVHAAALRDELRAMREDRWRRPERAWERLCVHSDALVATLGVDG